MISALKPKTDERYDIESHFGFGDNWAAYAAHITPEKIQQAEAGLLALIPAHEIQGKTFLDIGCGSGLHSLAALRAGAAHVTAIDFDPTSVKTAQRVLDQFWTDTNVDVFSYNILDPSTYRELTPEGYDVVYSWGVLHHTGDMIAAIKNAASFVAPGGLFVVALYKKTPLCNAWAVEKKIYSSLPNWARWLINMMYASGYLAGLASQKVNAVDYVRTYEQKRGMRFMTDVVDWLGGYPYQSISPAETKKLIESMGFEMVNALNTAPVKAQGLFGSGCAEYVFRKNF